MPIGLLTQLLENLNLSQIQEQISLGFQEYFIYIVTGLLALSLLFWGKTIFRIWLVGTGLTTGYSAGVWLSSLLGFEGAAHWMTIAVAAIAAAVLFGLAYKLSFFLAGAALGVYLAWYAASLFNMEISWIIGLAAAILVGIMAAALRDRFVMLATAVTGSLLLVDAVLGAVREAEPFTIMWQQIERWQLGESLVILLLVLGLTLLGYFTQSGKIRR